MENLLLFSGLFHKIKIEWFMSASTDADAAAAAVYDIL